jgi:murein DD-endopeptidase MepM/ murein hydrolase activator NlpD
MTVTPTPITYQVRSEDDMYGIAFRFGISPQALMTANPKVNPRSMSVGIILVIPVTVTPSKNQGTSTPLPPTATPVAAILRPPDCYSTLEGAWCFMLIKNNATIGLENLAGSIRLTGQPGAALEQIANAPLDLLPSGASLPLVAFFPAPVPAHFLASGQITRALPQPLDDSRYLAPSIQNQSIKKDSAGVSAEISGQIALPASSANAQHIRLAAVAYSADGAVVGLRQLEFDEILAAGAQKSFSMQVFSLGPAIDNITLLVEARP